MAHDGDRVLPTAAIFTSACLFELVPKTCTGESELGAALKHKVKALPVPKGDLGRYRDVVVCS